MENQKALELVRTGENEDENEKEKEKEKRKGRERHKPILLLVR